MGQRLAFAGLCGAGLWSWRGNAVQSRGAKLAEEAALAEQALLGCGGAVTTVDCGAAGVHARRVDARANGGAAAAAAAAAAPSVPPTVLLPGYGAGLAFWWRNVRALAARGSDVLVADLPGSGLSPRSPKYRADGTPEGSSRWFVERLGNWHAERLDAAPVALMGHSFGGYMAGQYALASPERVAQLVLVGPAGVGHRPPPDESLSRRFPAWAAWYLFAALWNCGLTPFMVMRNIGEQRSRNTVREYVERRFTETPLSETEKDALARYMYSINALEGSGEHALRHVLAPGGYGRRPLIDDAERLARIPSVTFVYGESDWMDYRLGVQAAERIRAAGGDVAVFRVARAGHYAMLDQPDVFDAILRHRADPQAYPAPAPGPDAAWWRVSP